MLCLREHRIKVLSLVEMQHIVDTMVVVWVAVGRLAFERAAERLLFERLQGGPADRVRAAEDEKKDRGKVGVISHCLTGLLYVLSGLARQF
jgi:hypothetical protein